MANRVILIALLLLGLAIAVCGGLEQAGLGRCIYVVHQVSETTDSKPIASQLGEIRPTLDSSFNMTQVSMYLGVVVVLVASTGLYLQQRRSRGASQ